jgi:hypothetical protein
MPQKSTTGTKATLTKSGPPTGSVLSMTGAKANTPRPGSAHAATLKPVKQSSKPVRLTERQADFLRKIKGAPKPGYRGTKGEQRTLDALADKKLLKRGSKHRESGSYHYMLSKTGEKHLGAGAGALAGPAGNSESN